MKKIVKVIASAVVFTATSFIGFAQNAYESAVKFGKKNENAVVIDFNKPGNIVEAALKDRLSKEGLGKSKSKSGYTLHAGSIWKTISNDKLDIYYKVESKKERSTVMFLLSKGYDNFITSGSDVAVIENTKTFLNSLAQSIDAYQLGVDTKTQEDAVKKAEKAYESSVSDGKSLLNDKEKIEKRIAENAKDQETKLKVVEEEKSKLNSIKSNN